MKPPFAELTPAAASCAWPYVRDIPLAAASLGQVHLAKLKTTGEQVIVKVQRPGLKEIFDIDLKNLRVIAVWLQKVDPKTDGAARDWVAIFDETVRPGIIHVIQSPCLNHATQIFLRHATRSCCAFVKVSSQ